MKPQFSGPTSFAPLIDRSIEIVNSSGGQFHVLLIFADGCVDDTLDCMNRTHEAIVRASDFPLVIVMVGIGDGPWSIMREFDDGLPERKHDRPMQWDNAESLCEGCGSCHRCYFGQMSSTTQDDKYRNVHCCRIFFRSRTREQEAHPAGVDRALGSCFDDGKVLAKGTILQVILATCAWRRVHGRGDDLSAAIAVRPRSRGEVMIRSVIK